MVNPHAAGGRTLKLLPEVERELERRAIPHRIIRTRSLEHGVSEARRAVEVGEIPVVMSGDGLIGQIGGALANSGSPLGIIPGGRGNDLARVLGIPSEPAGSVATLAEGHVREIDVGEANGRRFLGIASCGFDSDANRIANEARLIRGNLVYAYAALRALAAWSHARFTITLDGSRTIELVGYSVVVANSRAYGGGMFIAPDAELDDGKFDVVLTGEAGKLRFLASLPKVFKGAHVENEEVQVLRASEVEVEADRDFAVYADGDHLTDLPARLGTLKRALRVIAPPPSA
ncbi:MAG TPA: diacylglycerol kinase family protein [Solirubrobacterales bacterium]